MSENRHKILNDIKVQGDLVRQLKAAKESKERVCILFMFSLNTNCCQNVYKKKKLTTKQLIHNTKGHRQK